MATLEEKFRGGLLGLAVGDALGALFEGQSPEWIGQRFASPAALIARPPVEELYYTDDTQMAIGVAETLIEHGRIDEAGLCQAFVANYTPSRGYGYGARRVLEAMEEGRDYRAVAAEFFPGGSFGNGAAMRVAPVGLFFHEDLNATWEQARLSALPTHLHPWGIEGAQLVALATALCTAISSFDSKAFFAELLARSQADIYRDKLELAARISAPQDLASLGNGIAAQDSAVTAIACFALSPDSYDETIGRAILLGGDTDTIAAMAGALSGAFLGDGAIPRRLIEMLEDTPKGGAYLKGLSEKLLARNRLPSR